MCWLLLQKEQKKTFSSLAPCTLKRTFVIVAQVNNCKTINATCLYKCVLHVLLVLCSSNTGINMNYVILIFKLGNEQELKIMLIFLINWDYSKLWVSSVVDKYKWKGSSQSIHLHVKIEELWWAFFNQSSIDWVTLLLVIDSTLIGWKKWSWNLQVLHLV